MHRRLSKSLTLFFCAGLAGCGKCNSSAPDEVTLAAPPFADAPTAVAVQANNRFACDLLRQVVKEQPGRNQFFSPWSISAALAIVLEGAQGQTALEMGQVLGLPEALRQDGDRPWKLDPYHGGFATLLWRYHSAQRSAKDQPLRDKLAQLRGELETLNVQIKSTKNQQAKLDLHGKASGVADTINEMQRQIDQYELNVANAVWAEKSYTINEDYEKVVARYYGTEAFHPVDFRGQFAAERAKINAWAAHRTRNKITDLLPDLKPDQAKLLRMVVVNAIYFKGQWRDPFHESATSSQPFFDLDGGKAAAALMRRYDTFGYAAFNGDGSFFESPTSIAKGQSGYPGEDGWQIAELPYLGDKLAMTVLLPRSRTGLPALEASITGENLKAWLAKLGPRTVDLQLPKFALQTDYNLIDALKGAGMKQAFSEEHANFHGISKPINPKEELHISFVVHKAMIEVNEKGTEAAAVTSPGLEAKSEKKSEVPFIPEFRADHPFVFLIRDTESGAILFLGRMAALGAK